MKLLNALGKTALFAILMAVAVGANAFIAVGATVGGACLAGIALAETGHLKSFRFSNNGLLRADIVVSDLVTEFGDYYINQKQNMNRLMQMLRFKTMTQMIARPAFTEDSDSYKAASSHLGSVVQAFQKAFTSAGQLEFKPRTIPLYRMKVDIELYPDDIWGTWVGFLADYAQGKGITEGQARKEWPLVRYMLEMDVIPQIHDDLERKEYYKGEFVAPTAGTAATTGESMNGIRKWLKDGLTSHAGDGSIQELSSWSGVSSTNIFDKAESIIDTLDEELEGESLIMAMSTKNKRAYLRDKRNTHGSDVNYDENKVTIDFYDNCRIVGLPSMNGTDDVWITPEKNFYHVRRTNKASAKNTIRVEELKRELFMMTDWTEGLGFGLNELVFAYVEAESSASGSASA
jgi:hypothetical protein